MTPTSAEPVTYPLTIEHALGTTVLEAQPERVATVQWANHEVPLALGVVPVGMAAANFGDEDGDGLLPWVADELAELDAATPVLFDENDGIDFEAVADTDPDVILAAYSGLTQEDYDTSQRDRSDDRVSRSPLGDGVAGHDPAEQPRHGDARRGRGADRRHRSCDRHEVERFPNWPGCRRCSPATSTRPT